jgi:hypothetical protein
MLSSTRDADAAERFFRKVLGTMHTTTPRVITVDKHAAYPPAFAALQQEGMLPVTCRLRQCKYLNNLIEQDHLAVKRRVNPGMGFGSVSTAQCTLQGYEVMHMVCKGQLNGVAKGDVLEQNQVINCCSGWWHKEHLLHLSSRSHQFLQHYRLYAVEFLIHDFRILPPKLKFATEPLFVRFCHKFSSAGHLREALPRYPRLTREGEYGWGVAREPISSQTLC